VEQIDDFFFGQTLASFTDSRSEQLAGVFGF